MPDTDPSTPTKPEPLVAQAARLGWIAPTLGILGYTIYGKKTGPNAEFTSTFLLWFAVGLSAVGLVCALIGLTGIKRHGRRLLVHSIAGLVVSSFLLVPVLIGLGRGRARGAEAREFAELQRGVELVNSGRFAEGEPLIRAALAAGIKQTNARILGKTALGLACRSLERRDEARTILEDAVRDARTNAADQGMRGPALAALGLVTMELGNIDAAEPLLTEGLADQEAAFGPESPGYALTLNNVATLRLMQDRLPEAEAALVKAAGIRATPPATTELFRANLEEVRRRMKQAEPTDNRPVKPETRQIPNERD